MRRTAPRGKPPGIGQLTTNGDRSTISGMGIIKELQDAILNDGRSQYALAKAAGLSPIQLGRFVRGERGLTTPAVDALCEVLGLELRAKRRKSR
jgi:hypothetical protein